VASTFKGNNAVIFDLFNEPYPEQADHNNEAEGWHCWLHGGRCAGISYQVAGMQTLVNAVRSAGAGNVLMLGGLEWSNDLTGWLSHEPFDPDHNLAASWHSYNFNACSTRSCWNSQIAPVVAKVPLIAGEIGENDCAHTYIDPLMSWLNSKAASYLAWAWNTDFNCASGPGLITSYNGTPTPYGAGYESGLRMLGPDPARSRRLPRRAATPSQGQSALRRRDARMRPAQSHGESPPCDPRQRLSNDCLAHLARAVSALDERDRYLGDRQSCLDRPPDQVDLEAVAHRFDFFQSDLRQGAGTVGTVSAGYIPQWNTEHHARISVPGAGEKLT
jgi:Cellulase (glycosyl hydrolase family 5)